MDGMAQSGMPAPPPGYSTADVVTGIGGPPPPPPGYSSEQVVPVSKTPTAGPAQRQDQMTMNDSDSPLTKAGKAVGGALEGVGEGVFGTAAGVSDLIDRATGMKPGAVNATLHTLAGDNENRSTAASIGYGGETLAEFVMGDEALKGLPISKRLEAASKIIKTMEGSPRFIQAVRMGVDAMMAGGRAAAVQGAQTLVRSGGDVDQAVEDAEKAGAVGTVLGGATGAAGELASFVGKGAEKASNLSRIAGNAATKEEVAQSIANKVNAAKDALHEDYENGIQDLNSRLEGSEVDAQNNALADKAKELLAQPIPEDHPIVAQAKNAAGDRLDNKVKSLLETISKGEQPGEESVEPPSGLVDQFGNTIESEPPAIVAEPYKVNDLVTLRQTIRKLADSYEYGDVNSRALRSLINGTPDTVSPMDQTIEQLAQQSGDDTALQDYRQLRSNYRDKINLFDEPVIQKLRDGKVDDAAKDFVGVVRNGSALPAAGKVRFNTDTLRGIIGDDGLKQFGRQVFGTMLQDSVEDSRFNPAKFVETWKKVNEETKGDLFDTNNAQSGLRKLARDAQSAADVQHLTRVGVLVPLGAVAGSMMHPLGAGIGTLLGLTVAEGGGIAKGRELLNYIANHPAVWKTYELAGKVAESGTAKTAATAARGAASQAVASERKPIKNVYQSLSGSL